MTDPKTEPGWLPLPASVDHGTINAYNNLGCRCEPCKLAWRKYQLPRLAKRRVKSLEPGDERHGTYSGYANYACRCPLCKEANRVYGIDYKVRQGRINADRAAELLAKSDQHER